MIASLHGKLESVNGDSAIVNVNGIGFLVYMPTSTSIVIGNAGQDVSLLTHMVVREDSMTLYGFASESELELFQVLIGVSGLGPRLALAMLSTMSVDQLSIAISGENADLLMSIPGIGKKMASRLILELKDKVSTGLISAPAEQLSNNAEVIAALTSLGYSVVEASRAVSRLPSTDISIEEKIRLALQHFSE